MKQNWLTVLQCMYNNDLKYIPVIIFPPRKTMQYQQIHVLKGKL